MQILIIGAGTVTSRLALNLSEHGHTVAATMASFTPQHLDLFDFAGMVVIAPEASITTEALKQTAERGKMLFVVAGDADGLAAWANGTGVPTFAYPLSDLELEQLISEIRRAESGSRAADEQFRRTVLGSDMAARIQSGMAIRKIAVTSPKGETGKTTTAVNLAVAFALSGITTYLIDADANTGAIQYHLRMKRAKATLIGLFREAMSMNGQYRSAMSDIASGARYLDAFTPIDNLPTLKVLPGMMVDHLGDEALQDEQKIQQVLAGLFEAGVSSGGVVIMDVGINPAHIVHRAALGLAEGIAIVIKPEIPDLAETRRWIERMLSSLSGRVGKQAAHEFVGSRVKLCYNQVVGKGFKAAHKTLMQALREDDIDIQLTPNGILPVVDAHAAMEAINSDRAEDILVWRYQREKHEELEDYTQALIDFACNFVPVVKEGAGRIGLVNGQGQKKGLLARLRK